MGVGIPGAFSANVSVGYSTGNGGDFTATAGASFGGFNAYGGYSTAAGGIAGAGFGFGGGSLGIFGISSSVLGAGINYSEAGGWSVNALGFQYGKGGLSSDPSIGVSATARWGIEYSVLESSESIGVVGKDQASITTDDQLNEFLDQRGVNYADYYASDVSIEKQIPNQLEGRYTDLYNRYRRNNGVISSLKNGQSVGGITVSLLNGFKRPYSLIYMSTHDTNRNLMISLNHEFIHSWQYAKFGYSDRKEWDKFAEASAYRYTKMYHLSVSVPTYLGPWFPFLYVWPKLPLIQ
ncbi:hypothetical protein FACS1894182_14760 [Bacteroidia bacterium]|nr:hypothetical protein FACS1894182_14760 [Bacteroidia bacterium]